jgi:23S rRNA (guanosine2251-2'-O)-methyltransferase
VSRLVLTRLVGTPHHQGVVVRLTGAGYASLDEVLAAARNGRGQPWFLVLDQVEDPGNVGNLLRTAEALGVHGAVLPRHRGAGLTPHAIRAASGALAHLPVARVGNLVQTLEVLKRQGCWILGGSAEAPGTRPPWELDLRGPLAVVLGNESRGLRPLVAASCDRLTRIPLAGSIGSLNVAAAGAAILYEVARQRAVAAGRPGVEKEVDRGGGAA